MPPPGVQFNSKSFNPNKRDSPIKSHVHLANFLGFAFASLPSGAEGTYLIECFLEAVTRNARDESCFHESPVLRERYQGFAAALRSHFSPRKCLGSTMVIQGMKVTISSPRKSTSK